MNCTVCGASVIQGPDGRWSCNCGASGVDPGPRPLLPLFVIAAD